MNAKKVDKDLDLRKKDKEIYENESFCWSKVLDKEPYWERKCVYSYMKVFWKEVKQGKSICWFQERREFWLVDY